MVKSVAERNVTETASVEAYKGRIARATSYIRENLAGEISLDDAAEAACFSKYHFHRIFTAFMGESFGRHVARLRLERAAVLLETRPRMSVTEVAMSCGFASPSVLSRDFTARFGMPPSAWKAARGGGRHWLEAAGKAALGQDEAASDSVSVRHMAELRLAAFFRTGPYGPGVGEVYGSLFRWAGPRGLLGPKALTLGISWDNPEITAPEHCRYSACVSIPPNVEVSGEAVLVTYPATDYLVLSYKGPEAGLSDAYSRLYRVHLPASGFEPRDFPALEFYKEMTSERMFDVDIAIPVRPID
jgi:AraC family transcriptional regulator